MNSPLVCGCIAVGSIFFFLSVFTVSFFEDYYTAAPSLLTINKKIKDKPSSKIQDANKSLLFKSFKIRYNQFFP